MLSTVVVTTTAAASSTSSAGRPCQGIEVDFAVPPPTGRSAQIVT